MTFRRQTKAFYFLCFVIVFAMCFYGISFLDKSVYKTNPAGWLQSSQIRMDSNWRLPKLIVSSWNGFYGNSSTSNLPTNRIVVMESDRRSLLIPSDAELAKMDEQKMRRLYWNYINSVQFLCRNQTRLGSFKDGGKEVCIDNEYKPKRPCLVYSFGSNYQFDFEQAVIGAFGCEIHTFDPTVNLNQKGKTIPSNLKFHLVGLDGKDYVTSKKWRMATLETIMTELNHLNRTLDFLKIDIEGSEWKALSQMFQAGSLLRAKQLMIEIHFANSNKLSNWGGVSTLEQLKVLRGLYEEGYRIFMREHNLYSLKVLKTDYNTHYTNVNEISLINLNYLSSD